MTAALRLPLAFDPVRLRADLAGIHADEWRPHFNHRLYSGDWSVVSLRAVAGSVLPHYADPLARDGYAGTEALARSPYFREVLASFDCPLLSVRLLRLGAGAVVKEHKDYNLSLEDRDARLHVVVQTNPGVRFLIGGREWRWGAGECWYGNFNLPHGVTNGGGEDRIHMVLDCEVNDWLRGMLPASG
ncbi:MAG: aspartyl/asparaginyl beta-hydroxylase domain-containing protein [Methylococcaceae bacterium]|nr:aspartyl/asparaginyl beta-hydroxylase domain-containing protein [Methylococcaceae bacterium]